MIKEFKNSKFVISLYRLMMTSLWIPLLVYYRIRQEICNDIIFCENFLRISLFTVRKNNWGDDLNKYFFEYLTGKKTVFIPYERMFLKHRIPRYQCIGSTLGFFEMDNTIIYGTGVIDPRMKMRLIYGMRGGTKALCVRGPKSRQWLLNEGVDCPEKYGDPALLLSKYYKPNIKQHLNQVLIIPHKATVNSDKVKEAVALFNAHTVDMEHYDKWTDLVDEIASSRFVISESLHGLIVAEAFGIPNVWVEFKEHWEYWEYKFEDYYESIGKKGMQSIKIYQMDSYKDAIETSKNSWTVGNIPYKDLLETFPFKIVVDMIEDDKV